MDWKTIVSKVVAVAAGVVMIGTGLLSTPIDANKILEGILVIIGVFAVYGVADRIVELTKQVKK